MSKRTSFIGGSIIFIAFNTKIVSSIINYLDKMYSYFALCILLLINITIIYFGIRHYKRIANIGQINNRFPLTFSKERYKNRKLNKNKVHLSLFHVYNRIHNTRPQYQDCDVSFLFEGVCKGTLKEFRFSIALSRYLYFKDLGIKAYDKITKKKYEVLFEYQKPDIQLKNLIIKISPAMKRGTKFSLLIKWQWKESFNKIEGCIGLPNYFANNTDKAILELDLEESSIINHSISAYRYKATNKMPQDISNCVKNESKRHQLIIINPDDNTDYYLYYEKRDI